jgi:hypothetical protein
MNLQILLRTFFAHWRRGAVVTSSWLLPVIQTLSRPSPRVRPTIKEFHNKTSASCHYRSGHNGYRDEQH